MKNFISGSQKIGKLGEDVACKFLEKQGYSILERNYTKKWGEIDIIAEKNHSIYFIEVKSKSVSDLNSISREIDDSTESFGRPEENMHPWKLKRLSRTIQTYLIHKRIGNTSWQFDLLVVYLDIDRRLAKVKKIENIVL
jgi:putative endonuclease